MRACAERARAVDDGVVASEDIPGRFEEEEREAGAGGGGMRGGGWLDGWMVDWRTSGLMVG